MEKMVQREKKPLQLVHHREDSYQTQTSNYKPTFTPRHQKTNCSRDIRSSSNPKEQVG